MKKSGKDRLKCVVYESTLSTADAVPLPCMGKAAKRGCRYSRIVRTNTRICGNNNDEIKPFPRGEGGERSEPDRVLAV